MTPLDIVRATRNWTRRLTKGCILLIWILVLVGLGGLAASGRASQVVVEFFKPSDIWYWSYYDIAKSDLSPSDILVRYQRGREYPPPIEAVLDELLVHPSWSERNILSHYPGSKEGQVTGEELIKRKRWVIEQYNSLFRRVESLLRALVSDPSVNVDRLSIARPQIPQAFLAADRSGTTATASALSQKFELPRVAVSWIKDERIRSEEAKERNSLVNTFFLLMVLGAFGSLIFLTKDYIEREQHTLIAAYIFRPVLGMFLAVAVFIVDIVAHSLITTASILQTRHETLFILALAAGMLSEQAYEALSVRLKAGLEDWKKKKNYETAEPSDKRNPDAGATGAEQAPSAE